MILSSEMMEVLEAILYVVVFGYFFTITLLKS